MSVARPASTAVTDPLLTIDEAADYLNVPSRMIRRLTSERRMAFVKVGRHVRIPISAAEAYRTERLVPATNFTEGGYGR